MLGSSKLLIFGIVSALVLSLLVVGASAEDVVKEVVDGGTKSAYAPKYILNDDGLVSLVSWLESENYSSSNPLYFEFAVYLYSSGAGVGVVDYVYADSHLAFAHVVGGSSVLQLYAQRTLGVDSTFGYEWFINTALVPYEGFNFSNTFDKISGAGSTFFSALLGIGSQLVGFVIARPIVLIPFVAMVFVLGYGVIRRLVKGV